MLFDWSQRVRYWESGNSCSGKKKENPQKRLRNVLCRQCTNPVSWLLLQEEGLVISKSLGDDSMSISSSNGWLSKWKKRYSISETKVALEKGDVSQETLSSELMRGYEQRNVWNMNEIGQFLRALWSMSAEDTVVVAKTRKRGQPGPFSLLRQARKTLLLLLEGVSTDAASTH